MHIQTSLVLLACAPRIACSTFACSCAHPSALDPAGCDVHDAMDAAALKALRKEQSAEIRRMKRRIGMQRARAQKKLEQFRMFKTQLLITCMLVQICADDGATAGLWIRHTRSRTKKERERLHGWDHEQLRFMALLFHAEHCSEATKWRYPPHRALRPVPPEGIQLHSRSAVAHLGGAAELPDGPRSNI